MGLSIVATRGGQVDLLSPPSIHAMESMAGHKEGSLYLFCEVGMRWLGALWNLSPASGKLLSKTTARLI